MALNPKIASWQDRVVWLVGASTGIGRATAAQLHAQGARVVVSARNAQALDEFVAGHPGSQAIALDSTNRQAVHAAARQLEGEHGRIDQVVYCAGTYSAMRATDFNLDAALHHQQVNYVGALYLIDAVLPLLLAQADRGAPAHLSLMASVAGYRGLPKSLAYGPTKAALINLAETLYLDLQERGVAVSVVNPGFVRTPLTAQNDFHMPALISPEEAATALLSGWEAGDFEITFPKRFTLWMKGLRCLHDSAYFALVRRGVAA
jgi:NAD(P)-dependent dehydrogenase (short-subunit alcohol dehydrogenase family)